MTRKIKNLIKDSSISSFNYSGGMGGGSGGVSEEMLTTKGDTHGYTTENARVPIGTNDYVLTADSTVALGLAWKAAGGGAEYSQLTTATTFTPTTQTGLIKVTVDGTDMTGGNIDVNVDGSSIKNVTAGVFENRVVKPATSLSIVSNVESYDLVNASYDSVSLVVSGQESTPQDVTFSSDGTKMYVCGKGSSTVFQYTLSTAWDLSTASYDSVSFSVAAQDGQPQAVAFKSDGTKMYMVGYGSDTVFQYTLSTAWDISTASYDSVSFSVASQEATPRGMSFKSDGTKMYIVGSINNTVFQYTLSTPWDISTVSYDSVSFSVNAQETTTTDVIFNSVGTRMYICGNISDSVFQYTLSTAWDISTASYDSISFSVASQESYVQGVEFSSDGTKMYVIGQGGIGTVYQYSTVGSFAGTARISIG